MNNEKLLLLAVLGIGAYMLMNRTASAAPAGVQMYRPGTVPNRPSAAAVAANTEAAAYGSLGRLLGGIYSRIGGSSGPVATPAILPDDSIAANPAGGIDPFTFEATQWGFDPANFSFSGG